ncbi:uncharacterized protein LOC136027893 [Artemia franciscana]|uniref:uncharacterized protein LOC136027893 n=1 Tax=Artemia franciscana TaxID=6661 RepID=UPI0032DB53F4
MENLFEETRDYVQCCTEQAAMLQQQQEYLHQQLLECQLKVYEELENSTTEGLPFGAKRSVSPYPLRPLSIWAAKGQEVISKDLKNIAASWEEVRSEALNISLWRRKLHSNKGFTQPWCCSKL